jgi:hypothetical protein
MGGKPPFFLSLGVVIHTWPETGTSDPAADIVTLLCPNTVVDCHMKVKVSQKFLPLTVTSHGKPNINTVKLTVQATFMPPSAFLKVLSWS